jgi:hypothetical protein
MFLVYRHRFGSGTTCEVGSLPAVTLRDRLGSVPESEPRSFPLLSLTDAERTASGTENAFCVMYGYIPQVSNAESVLR